MVDAELAALAARACEQGAGDERANDLVRALAARDDAARALVDALGPQITSSEPALRGRATRLLAAALRGLGELSEAELLHLSHFFCSRLQDYACAAAVLEATDALVARLSAGSTCRLQICDALLDQTDVRSLPQAERAAALRLTLRLCGSAAGERDPEPDGGSHGGSGLINGVPGTRFVLGVLRAFDGEKDPRNLLLYLQLLRHLCQLCEEVEAPGFDEAVAEVFDGLSFYFPISFTPPPDDQNGITQAHLLSALLRTITSSRRFAALAIPFFLQHLTAEQTGDDADAELDADAAMQALQALATLARAFGARSLSLHADLISQAMRSQLARVLSLEAGGGGAPAKPEIERDVWLDAIGVTLAALAVACGDEYSYGMDVLPPTPPLGNPTPSDPRPLVAQMLTPVLVLCATPRPLGAGAVAGGKLLRAIVQATPQAAALAVNRCIPLLLQSLDKKGVARAEQADALAQLLALLNGVLIPSGHASSEEQTPAADATRELDAAFGPSEPAGASDSSGLRAAQAASVRLVVRKAVRAASPSLRRVASALLEEEERWPTHPSLRAPAVQLLCLSLQVMVGDVESSVETTSQSATAAPIGYDACFDLIAQAMVSAAHAAADEEDTANPAISDAAGREGACQGRRDLTEAFPTPRDSCSAIAISTCKLLRIARAKPSDTTAKAFLAAAVTRVREPLFLAFKGSVAAPGSFESGFSSLITVRLGRAMAIFLAEHPAWEKGATTITAAVESRFGCSPGLATVPDGPDPADLTLRAASDALVATLFDGLAYGLSSDNASLRAMVLDLLRRLIPSWSAAAESICLTEAEASVEGASFPPGASQLDALIEQPRLLCAVLCESDSIDERSSPPWLHLCCGWLMRTGGEAHAEPICAASEPARFRLMPFLERAIAKTPTAVPLPTGFFEQLMDACRRSDRKPAPRPLLRSLCAAANKWVADEQLAEAIRSAQPAAIAGSIGELHRWAWLAKASVCRGGSATARLPAILLDMILQGSSDVDADASHTAAMDILEWLSHACCCLRVLVEQTPDLLLKTSGAKVVPFMGQRVVSSLLPKLRDALSAARPTSSAHRACVHAIVQLLLAAPPTLLPSLGPHGKLVSLWVHWVATWCCQGGSASEAKDDDPTITAPTLAPLCQAGATLLGGENAVAMLGDALKLLVTFAEKDGDNNELSGALGEALPTVLRLLSLGTTDALPLTARGRVDLVVQCVLLLECAADVLPYHILFPLKRQVLAHLQAALDHRKRVIRTAASRCSNRWHALSA